MICLDFPTQIATFMTGNLEFFGQSAGYRTRGHSVGSEGEGPRSHPAVNGFRQKAAQFLNRVNKVTLITVVRISQYC